MKNRRSTRVRPAMTRSEVMGRVRSKNTRPELVVRSVLHDLGYRYRLHSRDLPGTPDIVFRGRRKAIQVHGCFWHGHSCKLGDRLPKTNQEFWRGKIASNMARDETTQNALRRMDWEVLVVWECSLSPDTRLRDLLTAFLGPRSVGSTPTIGAEQPASTPPSAGPAGLIQST